MTELRLRPLRLDDEPEAVRAHDELAVDGFDFLQLWQPGDDWASLVERYAAIRCGRDLPERFVPSSFLVAEVGGVLVGRVSVRHELNDWLARFGGHIGYAVRPGHRRRGHATEMLRQSLVVARAVGVDRALVTCDDDNLASAATIERCGGVLDSVVDVDGAEVKKRRYWID
ncbi:GNAT family N-acetyltransferase [Nocardioides ferulae]|uniref:GNAT family N-acetyltransferase n=1 Tax=Nocardioides ferulae TaxID=2340821 RepID=UPI000EB2924D|nr:GNAT family N-acetyltransferase [Nocardioides ferulae]